MTASPSDAAPPIARRFADVYDGMVTQYQYGGHSTLNRELVVSTVARLLDAGIIVAGPNHSTT